MFEDASGYVLEGKRKLGPSSTPARWRLKLCAVSLAQLEELVMPRLTTATWGKTTAVWDLSPPL